MKRDDLIHPVVSGNKWRKLKYNLQQAQQQGYDTLLSYGGAYSNHIHALAEVGRLSKLRTIGIIRGEVRSKLNATLSDAVDCGMHLHYLNRADYRKKYSLEIQLELKEKFGDFYDIPEGGSNYLAVLGCQEIATEIDAELAACYREIILPCGTGTTLAGIVAALPMAESVLGVATLKGAKFLYDDVNVLLSPCSIVHTNWDILLDYHHGGYAKLSKELCKFVLDFNQRCSFMIEPVYSGKMFYALYDRIKKGYYSRGDTLVALHTGGLQGMRGMQTKMERF